MITVRIARAADADAISRIAVAVQTVHAAALPRVFQPASDESFPVDDVRALMATPHQHFWLGLDDMQPVGYLYAEVQERPATRIKRQASRFYVHEMGVRAAERGRGVGTALLRSARDFAAAHGLSHLVLDVWDFNARTQSFYERQGFTIMRHELWSAVDGVAGGHDDPAV